MSEEELPTFELEEAFEHWTGRYMCGCQVEYADLSAIEVLCEEHVLPMTHIIATVRPELVERICERLKSKGNQEDDTIRGREVKA